MGDEYDNDDYDFDDFEEEAESPKSTAKKRIGTPHSSKKSPEKVSFYGEDGDDADGNGDGEQEQEVNGQDLETYLKRFSSDNLSNANLEDLACELKPLEGVRPKFENAEEGMLMQKLGYSLSNNSSPVKGRSIKISTNSPSPIKQSSFQKIQEHLNVAFQGVDENPSTRTSKDNKTSPAALVPKAVLQASYSLEQSSGDVSLSGEKKKPKLKAASFSVPGAEKTSQLFEGDGGEDYMLAFKTLTITSPGKEETLAHSHITKERSPKGVPNVADLLLHKRSAAEPTERENAERVDALLMELFPERFQKQAELAKKGKGTKTSKKATALALATAAASAGAGAGAGGVGYSKNQVYGLAAPRPTALSSLDPHLLQPSAIGVGSGAGASFASGDDGSHSPVMANLDQQLKLLKRELKAKDDKIQRLTEHAVMMGNHMDKLKAEAAHLTVKLREANMELEAKEGRLQEVLKQKKKLKKAAAVGMGGGYGTGAGAGGGGDASVALLEQDNIRLREREQALMEAIEELSNQNEDLIQKLKESMERELVLSSKRAAIVSHNVHVLAEQHHNGGISNSNGGGALHSGHHSQSHHHLPHIGARAEAGLRTQSEPVVSEPPKRRKKKASFG